jgi:hypothetical protein
VEELLLRRFLAFEEMDVVDQQEIDLAVLISERGGGIVPNGVDQFDREPFG